MFNYDKDQPETAKPSLDPTPPRVEAPDVPSPDDLARTEPGGLFNSPAPAKVPETDPEVFSFLFGNEETANADTPVSPTVNLLPGRPPPDFLQGIIRPSHDQATYPLPLLPVGRPSDTPLPAGEFRSLRQAPRNSQATIPKIFAPFSTITNRCGTQRESARTRIRLELSQ
mgnify:CR=1 FL=1